MHIDILKDLPGYRLAVLDKTVPMTTSTGYRIAVHEIEWIAPQGDHGFLVLTDQRGKAVRHDPLSDHPTPAWLASTAPEWCDLVPASRKAVG